jgi:acyl-CoA dehydrogenase
VFFDDAFVPDEGVLGAVDQGSSYTLLRLGPARMTYVTRWPGASRRAYDVAVDYIAERDGLRSTLGHLGTARKIVADNAIDIAATQALLVKAC